LLKHKREPKARNGGNTAASVAKRFKSDSVDENRLNERPIWLFENGDMYLDEWKMRTKPRMDS
jgi:hypothetical protein